MITCPICDYHYSEKRTHCPTCGAVVSQGWYTDKLDGPVYRNSNNGTQVSIGVHVAKGAERARQLPQSPRFFQLVN